jgi:hypothetical protein
MAAHVGEGWRFRNEHARLNSVFVVSRLAHGRRATDLRREHENQREGLQ